MPTPKWFNGLKEQGGHHPPVFLFFTKLNVILLYRIKIGLGKKLSLNDVF